MKELKIKQFKPLNLKFKDDSWIEINENYQFNKRSIVRAIVYLEDKKFAFVTGKRNDIFGNINFIETSGGGVEKDESLEAAIKRELKEELGLEVEILAFLGTVNDYYNLINRENINNYFLVIKKGEVPSNLTIDEINSFHLKRIDLSFEEAIDLYKKNENSKLGHLIAKRELPILELVNNILIKK